MVMMTSHNRNLLSISFGFLLLANPALSCFSPNSNSNAASSTTTKTSAATTTTTTTTTASAATTSAPPNQQQTPSTPAPLVQTCGHNIYYTTNLANPGTGIINGVTALPNQYPWMVRLRIALSNGTLAQCQGVLIPPAPATTPPTTGATDPTRAKYILTTASCANLAKSAGDITAVFADWDRNAVDTGEAAYIVNSKLAHPFYSAVTKDYDYAILSITDATAATSTTNSWKVQFICLPTATDTACSPTSYAYVSGWGVTTASGTTSYSQYLQSAYVKIADPDVCTSQYGAISSTVAITSRMTCAGYIGGGVDFCAGDTGAPLMIMDSTTGAYKLCGLASFNNGCAQAGFYGVYSKVQTVAAWITSNTL